MAANIQDREQQLFALTGLLTFTDKLLDDEMADKIKGVIRMTKVARLFEEEKLQALAQVEEEKRNALAQSEIVSIISGFSLDDIEAMKREIAI